MTKEEVVDKYLGIPYEHQGRTMKGLDCYGLAILVYKDLGYDLFDIGSYDKNWAFKGRNHMLMNYHRQWEKMKGPKATFDAILFVSGKGVTNHGGLVLDDVNFIHCCKQGVCVSRINDAVWKNRIEGYYHLRGRDVHKD